MFESLLTIATSKRAMVTLVTAVLDVLVLLFGKEFPEGAAEVLATLITTMGGILVAAYTHTDAGAVKKLKDAGGD